MTRKWMAHKVLNSFGGLSRVAGLVAIVGACSLNACSTTTGTGGSGTSAAAAGTACNPAAQNQGCFNNVRMQCTADASVALGGKWSLAGPCGTNESCVESADPSSAVKHLAQCKSNGGTGTDATTGSDGTTTGGDDTGTTTKDTGGTIGSCGDGFCNTGETAASCPSDCGTGAACGNGTCDAGETKANCPSDCGTTTNNCGNGTCDAGETTANCATDCPGTGTDPTACLQANCSTEYNACGTDQKCVNLLSCLNKCTSASDTACINACASTAGQAAVTEYTNLGNCGTTNNCFAGGGGGTCGDGTCDAGETKANCPADCGTASTSHICDANCGSANKVGKGCYCDNQCNQYGDCCDAAGDAPNASAPNATCAGSTCADCNGGTTTGPVCGNGTCETGETTANCAKDCPATTTPVCGNGKCETGETTANCPGDCPAKTCTTYADVQTIFQNSCNGCHNHKFGNGCSSASNYSMIAAYVSNGSMPQGKTLTAAEKAKIAAWAAAKNACTTASCP